MDYEGTAHVTEGGLECQAWASLKPHKHGFVEELGGDKNYCRNPESSQWCTDENNKLYRCGHPNGPWCFTTSKSHRWQYCNVPLC